MSLLFLASICFLFIPEMLKAVIFAAVGHSLPVLIPKMISAAGILGGFILLIIYVRKRQSLETPGILVCLEGLLPALCAYMLTRLAIEFLYPVMAVLFLKSTLMGVLSYVIVTGVLFILQGLAFYAFVIRCSGREGTFGSYIRRIYLGIPASLLVGIVGLGTDFVNLELPVHNVAVHFLMYLLGSLLMAGLLWCILWLMGRMAQRAAQAPSVGLEFRAYNTFFTVGAILLLGFSIFRIAYQNPVADVEDTLDEYLYDVEMDLLSADLNGAADTMDTMISTLAIWKQLAGIEDNTVLENRTAENPTDPQLLYLSALISGDTSAVEKYIRIYGDAPELSLALLALYNDAEITTDLQILKIRNQHKHAAIVDCIEHGYYISEWPQPEDIQRKALKFAGSVSDYTQYEQVNAALQLIKKQYQEGAVSKALVDEALVMAEQYPDNWMVQYTAAQIGSSLKYDDAKHYEKTGEAAVRYLDLYISEKDPSAKDAYGIRLSVAQLLMDCYQPEKALTCLRAALDQDENGNAYMMLTKCYNELNMLEECYETSADYLKRHPENSYALYYGALSAIKLGMQNEALQMTSSLASALAKTENDEERIYLDFGLYSLLQYISFNDNDNWTGYQYSFYKDLTEEQWQVINENAFFANYLNAVYNCFKGDLETALQLTEEILKEQDQLPNVWYLKGTILYNMQDVEGFEEAVEAYRKVLAITPDYPAAWYALANVYDGLEEYEQAIEACEHALALLPEQDHGEDWYGISIHCGNLLNALKDKVE